MSSQKEVVIARFNNSSFGTTGINAQLEGNISENNDVWMGHIKFNTSGMNPYQGAARAEIYPLPREFNGGYLSPSLQMVLPPAFLVPSYSHSDHRKN